MAAAKQHEGPARPTPTGAPAAHANATPPIAGSPVNGNQWRPAATLILVFVVLSAAILLVYVAGIRAPFIYDDGASITTNHSIFRLWPLVGAPGSLNPAKDLPTSGRPLVNLSLALNYHFGRFNPFGYHLVNYTLHALCATMVWALVRRIFQLEYFRGAFDRAAPWLAFAIAIVWALHPLQTQSVEYVTQRSELMVGFCYLSTVYASLRYFATEPTSERAPWLAVATVSCWAGMACKEMMATAPVMVAIFDYTLISGSWRRAAQKSWPLYLALASGWLLLVALNMGGPRSASAGFQAELPAHVWWLTQTEVVAIYVKLAFWPWPLLMHYELPRLETFGAAWPWVLPVAAAVGATLVLLYRKKATGLLGAWFFLILSPTLVVPIVSEVAAERRMYLPLLAIVIFVVIGFFQLIESLARRVASDAQAALRERRTAAIVLSAALALSAVYGIASARRVKVYLDPVALWQTVIDVQPDNVVAQASIAEELSHAGRASEADDHMQKALSIGPDSYVTHHLAGTMLLGRGQHAEAIAHFRKVVDSKPKSASAYNNLAVALNAAGQAEEAVRLYEKALAIDPNYVEAHNNLATALANQGKLNQALEHYAIAVRMEPDLVGAHKSMGVILINAGRMPEGIDHLETAGRLEPDVDTYAKLAIAYANSRRIDRAIAALDQALALARAAGQAELVQQLETLKTNLLTRQTQPGQ
ncbi:MAG TPA: tetratricopeptide repeat protein [Pirellulales bacterium]